MFEYFAAIFGRTKNFTHVNICSTPILLHFQISRDSQRNMTFIPKTLCKMQKQETGKNLLKYSCLLSLSYFWGWLHICPFPIQIVNSHTELQNLIWNDEWEGKKCHNRFHRFFLYLIQFLYNRSFYSIQNFTISRGRFPGWFVLVSDPPFLVSESSWPWSSPYSALCIQPLCPPPPRSPTAFCSFFAFTLADLTFACTLI